MFSCETTQSPSRCWKKHETNQCFHEKRRDLFFIIILISIIALGVLLLLGVYAEQRNEPRVVITNPQDGVVVGMFEQVTGTSKNVPSGSKVWVVIRVGSRYYPQPEPRVDSFGNWKCDVQFGGENDGGLAFDVITIIANETEQFALTANSEFTVFPFKESARMTVYRASISSSAQTPSTPLPTVKPTVAPTSSTSSSSRNEPVATTPSPVQTSITITSPANNAPVNMYEWVSGTSQNIPTGRYLWIIVRVDGKYFAHEVLTINANGNWGQDTQIGQVNEGGKRFDVIAVLADSFAHVILRDWRDKQNTTQQYDLTSLPAGTTQYDTISVTRRSSSAETAIAITSPVNNANVGMIEWVSGTSQNIPAGQQLWIVVHEGNLYFPMMNITQRNTDGTWQYNTTIGKEDDAGKSFEIMAVLANNSAQETVQAWYQKPLICQVCQLG
jgi:hypothetical protein